MGEKIPTTDNWKETESWAQNVLGQDIVAYIADCRERPHPESYLIGVLHKVQENFGYISPDHAEAVAQLLRVPAAKVTGVASFYHYFRLQQRGRFIVRLCLGTACYVKGAERVGDRLKEELGIDFGETTTDGVFTLEPSRCLGICGLAPVLMVDEDVHGHVTADQVPGILEKYFEKARAENA